MTNADRSAPKGNPRLIVRGLLIALAANTLPAWLAWKVLEDPQSETVLRSDLRTWLLIVGLAAGATAVVVLIALWRSRRFALGLIAGTALAGIAVILGLGVDLVGSGGSLSG